ncbi:MAG: hypothetical protein ABI743_04420, partial [bacterium]
PTRAYNADGLAMIHRLRGTTWGENFDPNHFLFGVMLDAIISLGHLLGLASSNATEVFIAQAVLSLAGVAALFALRAWLQESGVSTEARCVALGIAGSTFVFWRFATDVDMYVVLTLCWIQALRFSWRWSHSQRPWELVVAACWGSLGALTHQLGILILIPIAGVIAAAPELTSADRRMAWGRVLLSGTLVLGGPYCYVAEVLYRGTPFEGLRNFVFNPDATGSGFDWACVRFAGHPLEWVRQVALGHWNLSWFCDDDAVFYAFRNASGHPLFDNLFWRLAVPMAWGVATLLGYRWLARQIRVEGTEQQRWQWIQLTRWNWIPLFVFLVLLSPAFAYYRLLYWPAQLLLLALAWDAGGRSARQILIGIVVAQLGWNLTLGIIPQSRLGHEPHYAAITAWSTRLHDGDLLIATSAIDPMLMQYLRAFLGVQRININSSPVVVIPASIAERPAFATLTSDTLTTVFSHIYLDSQTAEVFLKQGRLTFAYRVMPSYALRKITLDGQAWQLGARIQDPALPVDLVELVPTR